MEKLVVENVDDVLIHLLKLRADNHGISVEAEHRRILEDALFMPKARSLTEVLMSMPDVGLDSDFERIQT